MTGALLRGLWREAPTSTIVTGYRDQVLSRLGGGRTITGSNLPCLLTMTTSAVVDCRALQHPSDYGPAELTRGRSSISKMDATSEISQAVKKVR